jgi:GT2 family glycosyltransferase
LLRKSQIIIPMSIRLSWDSIVNDSRKVEKSVSITNPSLRRLFHRDGISDDGIWGCNFSIFKEFFYAINGCDEDFVDGSIEDNDLGIRVLNIGGKVKSVRALAIVFHLWHPASWNFENEEHVHNKGMMEKRIMSKEARCVNGILK